MTMMLAMHACVMKKIMTANANVTGCVAILRGGISQAVAPALKVCRFVIPNA
jgi:hypothetical protein